MFHKYLVTFKSTTAALRALLLAQESESVEPEIKVTVKTVPVPFNLSDTCFGIGIEFSSSDKGIHDLHGVLKAQQIDYKNFWLIGKEYTSISQELEKE